MSRVYLPADQMPKTWYNILPDLPTPLDDYINPATGKSVVPQDLEAIFPPALIEQEVSSQREIPIPEKVQELLALWRPTPLIRATQLEKALGTPAKIYFKYEGTAPAGSHKANTAIPQMYYNKLAGIKKITTETGAGQWGSSVAFAAKLYNLACTVYMVKSSFEQKPYRKSFMKLYGADVIPSPSNLTASGRSILEQNPQHTGSLGIAISEAVEVAAQNSDTNYALGSVLNHVLLHQTVIGEETKRQMAMIGEYPDKVIACCGGGSNFGGLAIPFLRDKINGKKLQAIAVEPVNCPTLTKGKYAYDYGDTAHLTPIMKMYTLGSQFTPPTMHAGGLRYHGMSPIVSNLLKSGLIEAETVPQSEIFKYGILFAHTEGIVPAPESSHAIAAACKHALNCKESGKSETILFCLSGHGFFDFSAYDDFLEGKLKDIDVNDDYMKNSMKDLPQIKG